MIFILACSCILVTVSCTKFGYPDYESLWTLITAQSSDRSTLYFNHSFGQLPGLTEVLVTPIDGPYKGFIFKATGNGDRDDDLARDYGGVVYLYNDVSVVVTVPKRANGYSGGYAIFTGEDDYWTGGSSYSSMDAYVKARCWLPSNIPKPYYQLSGIHIESGSSSSFPTFLDYNHGCDAIPDIVNVRTRLGTSSDSWYSDAQGTNRHISQGVYASSGGVVYGYNNKTVRVWIPSLDGPGKDLFVAVDGWDLSYVFSGLAVLEIRAWCNLENTIYTRNLTKLGPNVTNEQSLLTITNNDNTSPILDLFTFITFQAQEGDNAGYHFNGIDGAMSQTTTTIPCSYGGFIYTYNSQNVILRRPSQNHGAAVCISDRNSNGEKTGPIYNGEVSVVMWNLVPPPGQMYQKRLKLYQSDTSIDYPNIGSIWTNNKKQCAFECTKRLLCTAVTFDNLVNMCSMFDYFSSTIIITKTSSEIWAVT